MKRPGDKETTRWCIEDLKRPTQDKEHQELFKVNLSNDFVAKLVYSFLILIDRFFNFQRFVSIDLQHNMVIFVNSQLATRADLNFPNE